MCCVTAIHCVFGIGSLCNLGGSAELLIYHGTLNLAYLQCVTELQVRQEFSDLLLAFSTMCSFSSLKDSQGSFAHFLSVCLTLRRTQVQDTLELPCFQAMIQCLLFSSLIDLLHGAR